MVDVESLAVLVREVLEDLVGLGERVGVQLRAEEGDAEDDTIDERVRKEECVGRTDVVAEWEADIERVGVELAE